MLHRAMYNPSACLLCLLILAAMFALLPRSHPRYHSSIAEAQSKLPFPAGFESVGVVVAAGDGEQQHVGMQRILQA